ncbi:MAG: helix-turn-helix domain-containing protein [Actinomycetota bacterium]|nr:helix-turn-helix domain-containing protein [Actinomycetota bacterium]
MSVKQMALVWELDLAPNKRLVLLAYADHADDDGDNVFPSLARVAHKTGYSVDQVRRISRELAADGLMEKVEEGVGRGNTHRYKLTLEKGSKTPPFEPKRKAAEKVASAPEKVASRREKVARVPPEPSEPSSFEPSGSRREASASPGKPKNWFGVFCKQADMMGMVVTPEDRERVPKHLNALPRAHHAADHEMARAIWYMLDARLRDYPMSPQEALNKVRGTPQRRHLAVAGRSGATIGATADDYDPSRY